MRYLIIFLCTMIEVGAALSGGVFVSTDTTGTNARPSNITITPASGGTNLSAGSLFSTNSLRIGEQSTSGTPLSIGSPSSASNLWATFSSPLIGTAYEVYAVPFSIGSSWTTNSLGNPQPDVIHSLGWNWAGGSSVKTNVGKFQINYETDWQNYGGLSQSEFYMVYTYPSSNGTNFGLRPFGFNFQRNITNNQSIYTSGNISSDQFAFQDPYYATQPWYVNISSNDIVIYHYGQYTLRPDSNRSATLKLEGGTVYGPQIQMQNPAQTKEYFLTHNPTEIVHYMNTSTQAMRFDGTIYQIQFDQPLILSNTVKEVAMTANTLLGLDGNKLHTSVSIGTNLSLSGGVLSGTGGGGGASDNWVASGSTNSTLPGIGSANQITGTNGVNIGGTTGAIQLQGSSSTLDVYYNGTHRNRFSSGSLTVYDISFTSFNPTTPDAYLMRDAAATLQMGQDAASPVAQKFKAADGSGTDKAGANLTVAGGQSTGTGRGGDLVFQTSPSGSTGSSVNSHSERAHYSAKAVALTESTATTFANIAIASSKFAGAVIHSTVNAGDSTDFQALTSVVNVSAVNKAGTVTATLTQVDGTTAASSGTLTCTYTAVANGNSVDIKANAVSSLTQTTLNATWAIVSLNGDGTSVVTAQ